MRDALLVFLGRDGGLEGWLRLADGRVAARGADAGEAPRGDALVAIVPGEQVALHWLALPAGLSEAQATGAARLAAAELSAQPVAELHVAVGPDRDGERCVALAPAEAMQAWLATLAGSGLDPDRMLPETLLLPAPAEGLASSNAGSVFLYRGRSEAFAAEPELAGLLLAGREAVDLTPEDFEAGLATALAEAPVDLRQGPFGRRREWRVAPARLRRLALLTAMLLLASLAVQVAAIARYIFAADAAEAETRRIAQTALPRSGAVANPGAALQGRIAELRGGGAGFGATAGTVFAAVRDTANVELSALSFSPDGSLRTTVSADAPAAIDLLRQRIEDKGFAVEAGAPRAGGGRRIADLTVRPR
ncbi:MAG: type II secretion system protein GspL [Allosphingosinicella sp.]